METIEITIGLIKIRTGIIIIIGKPKDHTTVIGNPIMIGNMKKFEHRRIRDHDE